MERLLREIQLALQAGLYLIALQTCATLPDICGALMSEDGKSSAEKYKEWYDQYAQPYLECFLTADDCYLFRNSILHQAKTVPSPIKKQTATYTRIVFSLPNAKTITCHNNIINDALNLDVVLFCGGMINATKKWVEEMEKTQNTNYLKNLSNFVRLYPNGFPPYIIGIPIIT